MITVTDKAQEELKKVLDEHGADIIRVFIDGFG